MTSFLVFKIGVTALILGVITGSLGRGFDSEVVQVVGALVAIFGIANLLAWFLVSLWEF